jgi:hypothetical protein
MEQQFGPMAGRAAMRQVKGGGQVSARLAGKRIQCGEIGPSTGRKDQAQPGCLPIGLTVPLRFDRRSPKTFRMSDIFSRD